MFNNIRKIITESFFVQNIDNIAFLVLLVLLCVSIFSPSGPIGVLAVVFSFLMLFKFLIYSNEKKFELRSYEKAFIIYFLIVSVSLLASTLFKLSLHGYIKTLIYSFFFFSISYFFKYNKNKVAAIMLFIAALVSFESVIAIMQNSIGISEISGWQDTSHINPEEIISRAYGTLKPYNPNLLAGYLLCGLNSFVYLVLKFLSENRKKIALFFAILFFVCLIAIIVTGSRGAYLGLLFFFPFLFGALIYYSKKKFGSIKNIKKRYKSITIASIFALLFFILSDPAFTKRFESIFALREDSSISFRFNVYESCIRMFLDNPFLGIGVGNQNFREIYGLYMKTGFDALGSYCVPLEIAVESGIFALCAFVCFVAIVLLFCFKVCKSDSCLNNKILALSIFLMMLAVFGHGFFDTIWFRPQLQILFWTNIAMLKTINKF